MVGMDTRTQAIKFFADDEAARRAGFDEKLSQAEAAHLLATPRHKRNAELDRLRRDGAVNRKDARAKRKVEKKARAKQRRAHA